MTSRHQQQPLNMEMEKRILDFCRRIADSRKITGVCICGSNHADDSPNSKVPLEILLIIEWFKPRLMNYVKFFNGKPVIFYAVEKWVFERDVDRGFLGEALAIQLLFPYKPLINERYFKSEEVELKKRLILEILENLVLDFPELSYEIQIEPEYFMYEALLSRALLFPPLYYSISNLLGKKAVEENLKQVMNGYDYALKKLEKEKVIKRLESGRFQISKDFVEKIKSRKTRFINLLRSAQKTLFMSLLGTFPRILVVFSQNRDLLSKLQLLENGRATLSAACALKDPKEYLLVSTSNGLVTLASKMDIEDFAKKVLKVNSGAAVAVEELGGVLNDVYLVKVDVNGEERRVVVKSFKDWSSFKWFPLTLWTFGTRTFALLGHSRLERECATNQFLNSKGFAVPKLLSISHSKRLVFMEYLEGETVEKVVKRIFNAKNEDETREALEIIRKVGETLAKVHAFNIALGDTKPENILVGRNGGICLMDFEQASRNGDKAWDIAEFLYYVGHYAPPLVRIQRIEAVARAFLDGYLGAGGDLKTVKSAGKPKYTKVFSVFVFPHIMLTISSMCLKAEKLRDKYHG
ncbi:MAG: phosphotransferase [Candidatus Bathyarchaeia archaeon]